jgi:hypothetical protein
MYRDALIIIKIGEGCEGCEGIVGINLFLGLIKEALRTLFSEIHAQIRYY